LRHHGSLRAEVFQLRGHSLVGDHIPGEFCESGNSFWRRSASVADGQSALPTSSGLTSP
jgi:hypothetical protein